MPVCLLFAAVLAAAAGIVAQREPATVRTDWIQVKLREGSGAVLSADGRLSSRTEVDLQRVATHFEQALEVERLVRVPLDVLDRWHREADERLPAGAVRPGHLGLWFRVHCRDAARMLDALREEPLVEDAYVELAAVLCGVPAAPPWDDIPPPTPDLTAYQTYRVDAPTGFGFESTRWVLGARGGDVSLYHVELDWQWDHEDLGLTAANFVGSPTPTTTPGAGHGTAVVGVLSSLRNGYGLTGTVDAIGLRLVSALQYGNLANSVAEVVLHARPGDVVTLIGGYNLYMTKPNDVVPYEYLQSNFDAILTATAQGLIVVTSAGNGDNDLDDPRFARRFDLSVRDSGSIMVAATDDSSLTRASFSNYGSRIDANGWGGRVTTLGFGQLFEVPGDPRQSYTDQGAGTSSAATLLSAVVGRISRVARRQLGRTLTAHEVRALLRQHGTPATGNISRRPDLVAILAALGLPDGLEFDRADVALGGNVTATMRGEVGSSCALAMSFAPAYLDLGLDRALHLDPIAAAAIGGFALSTGSATWSITIPNDPGLADLDLYFQALVVRPSSGGVHVTNSAAIWLH